MTLHLLKLCVGADSVRDLEDWIAERLALKARANEPAEHVHTTRMTPKRASELLDDGSLYWVIKGQIAARQRLLDIRPFVDSGGVSRCRLVLDPTVIAVRVRACRPFQGWRYLQAHEAPADVTADDGHGAHLPEAMRIELRQLGLL